MQLLRVYNLTDALQGDPRELLEKLQHITEREPSADKVYAMSELAYLSARKTEKHDNGQGAGSLRGRRCCTPTHYLFDDRLAATRNCLRSAVPRRLRPVQQRLGGGLADRLRSTASCVPGTTKTIHTAAGTWDITCVLRGGVWQPEDFDHFEFVSDYEMKGLKNHYQTPRAGRAADRRAAAAIQGEPAAARYYPPDLSFPVTAFLRPRPQSRCHAGRDHQGLLELYDPLEIDDTPWAACGCRWKAT